MNRPKPGGHHPDRQQAGRGDRPARTRQRRHVVEQEERPETQRGRADEPDLHRPEQVLEAAPEERDDERDADGHERQRPAPDEDVDLERDRRRGGPRAGPGTGRRCPSRRPTARPGRR